MCFDILKFDEEGCKKRVESFNGEVCIEWRNMPRPEKNSLFPTAVIHFFSVCQL
ncbi:unnamed protein product [Onchocerca flexuosa]|uniref:Uncharacterized protein n=1 Tax=Onchocerca flexuosa TaxID=387005 RepID=A0A183I5Q3_9BILA|nr:unnamed protein product [Onchocerca flexuosa]